MTPALVRPRQEDEEFKTGFSFTVNLRLDLVSEQQKEPWSNLQQEEKRRLERLCYWNMVLGAGTRSRAKKAQF